MPSAFTEPAYLIVHQDLNKDRATAEPLSIEQTLFRTETQARAYVEAKNKTARFGEDWQYVEIQAMWIV